MAVTLLFYIIIAYDVDPGSVYGIVSPCAFVWLISYFVATIFSEIYSMGIQTLLFCYLADMEMFSPAERFAEQSLVEAIQRIQRKRLEMKRAGVINELRKARSASKIKPNAAAVDSLDILDEVPENKIFMSM
jgi:hypothetical protein